MERNDRWIRIIISLLFTGMLVAGLLFDSVSYTGTVINGFLKNILWMLPLGILFGFIFYFLTGVLYRCMDRASGEPGTVAEKSGLRTWGLFLGILFAAWLPYLIICFPTVSLGFDYYWQLLQGTGVLPLSNHHPVFGSLVFGALYKIGYLFGGASAGLFFTSLVQVLLMCSCFALFVACLKWMGCPKWFWIALLVLYAACPVFISHGIWVIKDSIFSSLISLFFLQVFMYLQMVRGRLRSFWLIRLPWIAVTGILSSIYRNGILPILIFVFLALVWDGRKRKDRKQFKYAWILLAVFLGGNLLWSGVLKIAGVYPTNSREALCMLSRQIVNTLRYQPDSLSEKDRELLEKVYKENGGLKKTIKAYDVIKADPVKPSYFESTSDMLEYISLWFRLGVRHMGPYLDAFLQGSYGYWYPFYNAEAVNHAIPLNAPEEDFAGDKRKNAKLKNMPLYARNSLIDNGIDIEQTAGDYVREKDPAVAEIYDVRSAFPEAREGLTEFMQKLEGIPVLSMLFVPGFYTWILFLALGYLLSRRKVGGYLWPLVLIVALCMLSPVNGYMRYFLPVAMIAPFLMGTCMIKEKKDDIEEETEEETEEDTEKDIEKETVHG